MKERPDSLLEKRIAQLNGMSALCAQQRDELAFLEELYIWQNRNGEQALEAQLQSQRKLASGILKSQDDLEMVLQARTEQESPAELGALFAQPGRLPG